jgi:hypothetical protein
MKRLAALVASAAAVTLIPAAANTAQAGPMRRVRAGASANWAGYVAHGGPFTSASTSWNEPSISCGSTENSAEASFAGIDGSGSSTVEQIGTFALCRRGSVTHTAFYEMFPRAAAGIGKPVRAGDSMTASVVTSASTKVFTLTLSNRTAGWTFTTQQRNKRAQLVSAEAITEAPTIRSRGVQTLANFGTENYFGTTANGQPISNFSPEAVSMVGSAGVKAAPTALSGGSFSVVWHHG